MPRVFYEISAEGVIGAEAVVNVFHVYEDTSLENDPTAGQLQSAITQFKLARSVTFRAAMVGDYILTGWRGSTFTSTGDPGSAIPQFVVDGGAGGIGGDHDGNGPTATLACIMGDLVQLSVSSALLKRAYFALGPIPNAYIDNSGLFTAAAVGPYNALRLAIDDPVQDLLFADRWFPIKVSHSLSGAVIPQITAYRQILDGIYRPRASFRRSRLNNR